MLRELAPSLSLAYLRQAYACLALISHHHLLEDYLDEVDPAQRNVNFFLLGTLDVPVSAVATA